MNEFLILLKIANLVQLLLDEILHRLDIMVCNLLDVLHTLSVILAEIAIDVTQSLEKRTIEILKLRKR